MKKTIFLTSILIGLLLLPVKVDADKYATVVNPQTGERKVVRVGDPHAFDGGFILEVAYGYKPADEEELGFSVVSSYKTNLSASMTSTQTTVPVASMETKDGHTLTMANLGDKVFLTIEPGGSKEEIVMCTGISGNYWTGCTRGLAFYATSTVTVNENRKSHIAGSIVIMSNVHYVYEQFVDKDTAETIEGLKTYTIYPRIATYTPPTLNNEFVAKKYVDDVAVAGAPNAGTTTKGIIEITDQNEIGTGTTTGETGAELVLPNRLATTTSVSGKYVVVTENDGKINQNFLDLNEDFAFTGTTTFATTTVQKLTVNSTTTSNVIETDKITPQNSTTTVEGILNIEAEMATGTILKFGDVKSCSNSWTQNSGTHSCNISIENDDSLLVCNCTAHQYAKDSIRNQLVLIPGFLTSARFDDLPSTTSGTNWYISASISGTTVTFTTNVLGGGSAGQTASINIDCYTLK